MTLVRKKSRGDPVYTASNTIVLLRSFNQSLLQLSLNNLVYKTQQSYFRHITLLFALGLKKT